MEPDVWRLIKRAAEGLGCTVTAFIVSAAAARARAVVTMLEAESSTPIASRVPIFQGRLPPHIAELAPPLTPFRAPATPPGSTATAPIGNTSSSGQAAVITKEMETR